MASVTLQLILFRLKELNSNVHAWIEDRLSKYYNLRLENVDVLDLYLFSWIIITLVSIVSIRIITKCIQLKVPQMTCFWISFTIHYVSEFLKKINLFEKLKILMEFLEYKIKSLNNFNNDIIKFIFSSSMFSNHILEKFIQSLNKEAERILAESDLALNFLSIDSTLCQLQIRHPITSLEGGHTLVICFNFELTDLLLDTKIATSDHERACQLHVRSMSGGVRCDFLEPHLKFTIPV